MIDLKYDRPEKKHISGAWVAENCKWITARDLEVIKLVRDKRLLSRNQIERLSPIPFVSQQVLNRRLRKMFKFFIIDKFYPMVGMNEGSSQQHVCLDRAGAILLKMERYDNKIITIDQRGFRHASMGWEHLVMINEYECIIREVAKHLNARIKLYQVQKPRFIDNNKKLTPDICFYIEVPIKTKVVGHVFFIEVDLGTEDMPHLKEKFRSYKHYHNNKVRWFKEEWNLKFFKNNAVFPKVFFFTNDGRTNRVDSLKKLTEDESISFNFHFHSEAHEVLSKSLLTL